MEKNPYFQFIRKYKKSEIIFEEGSIGSEMFIVYSGKVKICKQNAGREEIFDTVGPGQFFGEMALVDNSPRSASAVSAADGTKVIPLNHDKFLYLISNQPVFALTIMSELCRRIRVLHSN
jgi:CRP-like cAMP-binding protein